MIVEKSIDSSNFIVFLMKFLNDGFSLNDIKKILIVLDNAAIHTVMEVKNKIVSYFHLLFLPPYSPLNPIEYANYKIKLEVKKYA